MPSVAQPRRERVRVDAVDGERDDAALLDAEVVERERRDVGELRRAATSPSAVHPLRDGVDAERERVVDRRAEAEPVGDAVLPALEPAGVVADLDARRRAPTAPRARRGTAARGRSIRVAPHVEEPGAARRRGGTCGPVAERKSQPERVDVDRELARRPGTRRAGTARPPRARPRRPRRRGSRARPASGSTRSRPAARGRRASSRSASTESCPYSSSGIDLDRRHRCARATCRNAMTLLAYSARDVRMRSPGSNDARQRVERPCPTRGSRSRPARSRRAARRRAPRPSRTPPPTVRRPRRRPRTRRRVPRARGARSTVSTTMRGGSDAPALLRWTTSRQPGVSARTRATSITGCVQLRLRPRCVGAPVVPVVGEVAHAGLLVLLDRPQQRVLVDAGLVAGSPRSSPRTPWRSCRAPS